VNYQIKPSRKIGGEIRVPGDKSIAHRAALMAIISKSPIEVLNFPDNADCRSSLNAAKTFGVEVKQSNGKTILTPPGSPLQLEREMIDCGNSGTTARLLAGIIAGSDSSAIITGDDSLSLRPMKRIVDPLTEMGAELVATDGHLPMTVCGKRLLPFEYKMPVASAQVKSAILLAAAASGCSVTIREDTITRNHTEIMLGEIGAPISVHEVKPKLVEDPDDPRRRRMQMPDDFKTQISLGANTNIVGGCIDIPGDFSTAAYFFAAAAISGGTVTIKEVGINRTRTAFLDYLKAIGCKVEITDRKVISGEARGTVAVTGGELKPRKISGETTAQLIDEIPTVAVVAAYANGTTVIRDAAELKIKECDRLSATAENLGRMGVKVGLLEDGLAIEGGKELNGADLMTYDDHRIAMAFSIAALGASGPSTIDNPKAVEITCPEFFTLLGKIVS